MAYDTTEAVAKFLSGFQMRNTRKRKGRSLTTSPPANGVCILSTPESVTVSMVA